MFSTLVKLLTSGIVREGEQVGARAPERGPWGRISALLAVI